MTIVFGTLIAVAMMWPEAVGRWLAKIVHAYNGAIRALQSEVR